MLGAHSPMFFLCNFPENTAPPLDISLVLCYRARVQGQPDTFAVLGKKFLVAIRRGMVYTNVSGSRDANRTPANRAGQTIEPPARVEMEDYYDREVF